MIESLVALSLLEVVAIVWLMFYVFSLEKKLKELEGKVKRNE